MNADPGQRFDFSYFDDLIEAGLDHAVFDLENTIVRSNVTELYLFMKEHESPSRGGFLLWKTALMLTWGPIYLAMDHFSRDRFQRSFYRRFQPYTRAQLEFYSKRLFREVLIGRFIPYVHDLVFHLKNSGVEVRILSTSTAPLVGLFGEYFDVPYQCLDVVDQGDGCRVDVSELQDFKLDRVRGLAPDTTLVVADSKHDLPILRHSHHPVVVENRRARWMRGLTGKLIMRGRCLDL